MKYTGKYTCTLTNTWWEQYTDGGSSTETIELKVKRDENNFVIDQWYFPVDEISDGVTYTSGTYSSGTYRQITFTKNKMYISTSGGGMGGGYSATYDCSK